MPPRALQRYSLQAIHPFTTPAQTEKRGYVFSLSLLSLVVVNVCLIYDLLAKFSNTDAYHIYVCECECVCSLARSHTMHAFTRDRN